MPGGFHPFHAGHFALYKSAKEAFPDADMYVAASDSRNERPFPFQIKQKLAQVAGVKPNEFVQVKSPFRSEEITAKYNPEEDVLIFVRSEKDKTEQPIPGGTKKDGTPAYFQPYNPKDLKPFKQHGYITYLPTVEFAGGIKSATEIRKQWPHLNARQKANMVQALYPNTTGNKKLIDNVVQLINAGMGELTEGDVVSFKRPQLQTIPKELEDAVSDWWQVKDTEDGKYMKASLAQRGIDVEHKDDNMIDDYVMVKWRDGVYRKKGIIKVDDIMEKLIKRAYQNSPDDNGPSVAEAYDPYDEADVLLRYDPADKKLKKRSWVHAKLDQAKREGWRYTAEEAMRVHGYFPSKYKQGEFVKKGIDGKWEKVFPYAQRTDERNIWDKIKEDQYWNVGDGQDEPAAGTQPSEELRLKKSHQYAGAFVGESVDRIRKLIKETSDDEKEKTLHLHRKLFQLMEEEKNNVIDLNKARDEKTKGQEKRNDVYHEKRKQQEHMLDVIQQILFGLHQELDNMMQVDLAPIEFIDFQQEVTAMIDKIENFDANDFPFYDDNGELLEMYKRVKFIKEAWLNSKSHTFESFRNDPILAPMPGGDVDTSGPKVLRPQEYKTKRAGPQPNRFWKVTKKHDYLPEK